MPVFAALAALGIAIALHGLAIRMPMKLDVVRRFVAVGFPVGIALMALSFGRSGFSAEGWAPVLLYAFLCELYIFSFTLVLSSVSVILLVMLCEGPVESAALARVYDPDEMVRLRLDRLVKNGFIARQDRRLSVTEKGMQYHRAFTSLRAFFGHQPQC